MRTEHVVVSIIIFLVVLLATLVLAGKIIPIFESGLNFIKNLFIK